MTLYLLLPPPGEVPDKMTNQKLHFLVNHQHVKLYGFNLFEDQHNMKFTFHNSVTNRNHDCKLLE